MRVRTLTTRAEFEEATARHPVAALDVGAGFVGPAFAVVTGADTSVALLAGLVELAEEGPALDHNSYVAPSPVFRLGEREVGELRPWQLLTGEESVSSLRSP